MTIGLSAEFQFAQLQIITREKQKERNADSADTHEETEEYKHRGTKGSKNTKSTRLKGRKKKDESPTIYRNL